MDEVETQATRRRILVYVEAHPGASARQVQRSLSLGWGETSYHLTRLLEAASLQRERTGRRDYYFSPGLTKAERRVLQALQNPLDRFILLELARSPGRSFPELLPARGATRSTVAFHLRFLLATDLVKLEEGGGTRRYRLTDPLTVNKLKARYLAASAPGLVDKFGETFAGLFRP